MLLSVKGMMLNCPLLCIEVSVCTLTLSANCGRIFVSVEYVAQFKDINKMWVYKRKYKTSISCTGV